MRIIYFGSAQFGIPSLEAIHNSRHELVRVFTQPARPSGQTSQPTDADGRRQWCRKATMCPASKHKISIIPK